MCATTITRWRFGLYRLLVQLVDGSYRDTAADGNTVYVKVEWYVRRGMSGTTCSGWGQSFSCSNGTSVGWDSVGQTVTPEIWTDLGEVRIRQEGGLWVNSELAADGDAARAVPTACAQFGWPVPDPCARAVVSFAY